MQELNQGIRLYIVDKFIKMIQGRTHYLPSYSECKKLNDAEFRYLYPYWLKSNPDVKKTIMYTKQFRELLKEEQEKIILDCANLEPAYVGLYLVSGRVKFDIDLVNRVNNIRGKSELLYAYLKINYRAIIKGKFQVDWEKIENLLTANMIMYPLLKYVYLCYKAILKPIFINSLDENKEFASCWEWLMRCGVNRYVNKKVLWAIEVLGNSGYPCELYSEISKKIIDLLNRFVYCVLEE